MGHVIAQGLLCLFVCQTLNHPILTPMLNGLDAQQAEA